MIDEVYFPLTCLISVTITMMDGSSVMVGVRRSGITETAHILLEKKGLIECSRKKIKTINRQGLEEASCKCYQVIKEEYELAKF